ncbi:hypothetical protein, partial [Enterococcus sp. 3H8_DIV0648]|uniref:hypothetical protein n=2 Tax=Enterococcus TaxID=1350 RepID=UPI000B648066
MVIDNKELETLERVMQFESKDNEKGLKMYLKTLSLEEVKKIQLVMYIGRGYIDGSISDDNIK